MHAFAPSTPHDILLRPTEFKMAAILIKQSIYFVRNEDIKGYYSNSVLTKIL